MKSEASSTQKEIVKTGSAWAVAIVAIAAAIFISASNSKLSAVSSLLLPAMGWNEGDLSFLLSINGYVAVVLAFVAPSIILRFGTRISALIVVGCAAAGALICAIAPNFEVMLIGRIVEGVGFSCIGTVVPVLFSEWFPPRKRGLPMGIFSSWVPLGSMFIMATGGLFFTEASPETFRNVFWFVLALLVVVLVACFAAVRQPASSYLAAEDTSDEKPRVSEGFKSVACWLTMVMISCFALGTACVMNFEPLYMVQTMGMTQQEANGMLLVLNACAFVGGVGIGLVSGKVVSNRMRLIVLSVCSACLAVCMGLSYALNEAILIPWLIGFGLFNGVVPALLFTMVSEIAPRPQLASVVTSLISCGQGVGAILFGVVGTLVMASGWGSLVGMLSAAGIIMFVAALALLFVITSRDRKRARQAEQSKG